MPNILEKYQALRNKIANTIITRQEQVQDNEDRRVQYECGQGWYRQKYYQEKDLNLQQDFINLQGLIVLIEETLFEVNEDQRSPNVRQEQEQEHEREFTDATNTFFNQAMAAAQEGIKANSYITGSNQWFRNGIISAFCGEIENLLKDVQEPNAMFNCLETVQQYMEEIKYMDLNHNTSFHSGCEHLSSITCPNDHPVNDIIDKVIAGDSKAKDGLLCTLDQCNDTLNHLLECVDVNTSQTNKYIVSYDGALFNFQDFLDDITELRQNMLDTPDVANIHLDSIAAMKPPTVTVTTSNNNV